MVAGTYWKIYRKKLQLYLVISSNETSEINTKTCLMSSISNRGFPIFFLSFYSKDLNFIYVRHLKERLSSSVLRKVTNYIPFCNWLIYPIHYAFLPSGYRFTYVYVKFCFPFLTWNFLPWKGFEVERYKH